MVATMNRPPRPSHPAAEPRPFSVIAYELPD